MPTTPLCPSLTLFIIMTLFHDYFLYSAYASLHEAASTSLFIFRAYLVIICGILWQSFLYVIANSFQLTYSANNFDVSILSHCSAISSFAWLCFLCAHYFHCAYFFFRNDGRNLEPSDDTTSFLSYHILSTFTIMQVRDMQPVTIPAAWSALLSLLLPLADGKQRVKGFSRCRLLPPLRVGRNT